jgi:hypothetical protein
MSVNKVHNRELKCNSWTVPATVMLLIFARPLQRREGRKSDKVKSGDLPVHKIQS